MHMVKEDGFVRMERNDIWVFFASLGAFLIHIVLLSGL